MKCIIANGNVLVGKYATDELAMSYIKAQDSRGDECKFDGYYFSRWELLEEGGKSIYSNGVDWNNLKSFDEYKAERDAAKKAYFDSLPKSDSDDEDFFDFLSSLNRNK